MSKIYFPLDLDVQWHLIGHVSFDFSKNSKLAFLAFVEACLVNRLPFLNRLLEIDFLWDLDAPRHLIGHVSLDFSKKSKLAFLVGMQSS